MIVRRVCSGRFLAAVVVAVSLCDWVSAPAASVSLAWNPVADSAVAGYTIFYGLASGEYSWNLDAGLNTSATVPSLMPGTTYYFVVSAYDASQGEGPISAEVAVTIPPFPQIVTQPVNQNAQTGGTVIFSVIATSPLPLSYQWFYGTNALPGATNSILTLNKVSAAVAGCYSVTVSNSWGVLTSSPAVLLVQDPPGIASSPFFETVPSGSSVSFSVSVRGTAPFTFQWYHGGTLIATGTEPELQLSGVTAANDGIYSVTVQNAAGVTASMVATLTVYVSFTQLAGTYNGLFYQTNGDGSADVDPQSAGLLGNCVVGTSGVYSANVYLGGFNYPLTGTLNSAGSDTETISRAVNGLSDLNVTLNLDMSGASQSMTGVVSNTDPGNPWIAPLVADLATNSPAVPPDFFVMSLVESGVSSQDSPQDVAFIYVMDEPAGTITLIGSLADGTAVAQTVPMSQNGSIPVYLSLYGGLGVAAGWINLANDQPNGSLTWVRPGGITTAIPYWQGFTNILTAQ